MPKSFQPDVKLAIRADQPANMVRAYFSALDDSDRVELASIQLKLLDAQPGLFERWKALILEAFQKELETVTGAKVTRTTEHRTHHKN